MASFGSKSVGRFRHAESNIHNARFVRTPFARSSRAKIRRGIPFSAPLVVDSTPIGAVRGEARTVIASSDRSGSFVPSGLVSGLYIIPILAVLILVHEIGHFV